MKKHFITYGDEKFIKAKERIISEAMTTNWFDSVTSYGSEDISDELKDTGLMEISRGGGLWAWKPDIIFKALAKIDYGDILVYADSGCTLQPCREWDKIGRVLLKNDMLAQVIYQRTSQWTRKEILDSFSSNPNGWIDSPQYCATVVILKKTLFTEAFICEWRDIILNNPEYIKDVLPCNRCRQMKGFIENRHDQSIYSALIYKHLLSGKIHSQWERIEDYDPIQLQAIRATRLRSGDNESMKSIYKGTLKRIYKMIFYRLLYSRKIRRLD